MSASSFALMAVVAYALENVLIERYLKDVPPLITMAALYLIALCVAVLRIRSSMSIASCTMPTKTQCAMLVLIAVLMLLADFWYVKALGMGKLSTNTMLLCLIPVAAAIMYYVPTASLPSRNQILAWILAGAAVWVVTHEPLS